MSRVSSTNFAPLQRDTEIQNEFWTNANGTASVQIGVGEPLHEIGTQVDDSTSLMYAPLFGRNLQRLVNGLSVMLQSLGGGMPFQATHSHHGAWGTSNAADMNELADVVQLTRDENSATMDLPPLFFPLQSGMGLQSADNSMLSPWFMQPRVSARSGWGTQQSTTQNSLASQVDLLP
ncbi:hypothetical protein ACEPAG_9213 [Sanghuangporus baumii]